MAYLNWGGVVNIRVSNLLDPSPLEVFEEYFLSEFVRRTS